MKEFGKHFFDKLRGKQRRTEIAASEEQRYVQRIRELIKQACELDFYHMADVMPDGFQYDVVAPYVPNLTPQEYRELTGFELPYDYFAQFRPSNEVNQKIGLLNVTDITTREPKLYYHSLTGGNKFTIKAGRKMSIEGISPQLVCAFFEQLVPSLQNPRSTVLQNRRHLFRFGAVHNLSAYNFDGTEKSKPAQQKLPPPN